MATSRIVPALQRGGICTRALATPLPLAAVGVRHASAKSAGITSQVCAVLGSQWGDEGKGKLADILAGRYDIIARFNGGANAGHTVVVNGKKYAFHLLPCGLIHPHTQNLLGNGTVIHLPSLSAELAPLEGDGINWKGRLFLSDRAHLLFDYHKQVDGQSEKASGKSAIGTTKQGIGPAYSSKASRTTAIRVGQMKHRATFLDALKANIQHYKRAFEVDIDEAAEVAKYDSLASEYQSAIVDGVAFIHKGLASGSRILAEGANAAMLDMDFGTYPFVTSSSTTAGGVCTGLGIPPKALGAGAVIGVVKAYTTRVGGGPFPTELTDSRGGGDLPLNAPGTDIGLHMQQVGREVGVTTGRKRRCGWFDSVVVRYAHGLNGFTSLNLTKLDVLDDLDELKIATNYKLNGSVTDMPAALDDLKAVEVEYETLKGWKTSTVGVKKWADLPPAAQEYVKAIEKVTGVPIAYIGTGPGREDIITRGFTL